MAGPIRPATRRNDTVAKVTMPQLGESVAEGTIGKWLKQPGDQVAKYEPLLEVITDKVNAEVPSPFEGVLKEILVQEGETVPNNAEIAVIETSDEAGGAAAGARSHRRAGGNRRARRFAEGRRAGAASRAGGSPPRRRRRPNPPTARPAPTSAPSAPPRAATAPAPTAVGADEPGNPDARMTPAVRRLLREHGLTAAQIVGTGGGGRITREDVTNYVETQRTGQSVGGQGLAAAAAASAAAPAAIDGLCPAVTNVRGPYRVPASVRPINPVIAPPEAGEHLIADGAGGA